MGGTSGTRATPKVERSVGEGRLGGLQLTLQSLLLCSTVQTVFASQNKASLTPATFSGCRSRSRSRANAVESFKCDLCDFLYRRANGNSAMISKT